jgi:uncharacterized protein (DUF2141 family)
MKPQARRTFALLAVLALSAALSAQVAPAQAKPEDAKKLYLEIAGDYTFDYQGQVQIIQFFEKDGRLFGAPVGETPEEIQPVKDKPLCFDITVASNGQYYALQFSRNEKGVIFKCVMTVEGLTIEGFKALK